MGCDPPAECKFSLDSEGDWIPEAAHSMVHTAATDCLLPGGGALHLLLQLIFTHFLGCISFPPILQMGN